MMMFLQNERDETKGGEKELFLKSRLYEAINIFTYRFFHSFKNLI